MQLILIRHAHAVDAEENMRRPLSTLGKKDSEKLAAFFRSGKTLHSFSVLWHSPLDRARETAQILFSSLPAETAVIETPGLQPEDSPEECAARIDGLSDNLVIVGHEPHLSALATLLVRGKTAPLAVDFPKCSALCLESSGKRQKKVDLQRWKILWHLPVELIPDEIRYP